MGRSPFARFMELALYHPEHGYYASGRASIGRRGDFFTNVSVGSLFGKLLAAQFAEIWEKLGRPRDFTIVEQGAHDGVFAADVLSALRQSCRRMFRRHFLRDIRAVSDLAGATAKTSARLQPTKFPGWNRLTKLAPFAGVHFSNELFDSLAGASHRFRWRRERRHALERKIRHHRNTGFQPVRPAELNSAAPIRCFNS